MLKLKENDIVALKAELCKRKLSFFVKEFWDVIVSEDLVWEPHMDVICDEIQIVYKRVFAREPKLYDLIINVPPGTTKSTIATQMAPAWSWAVDDSIRHITGSYADKLATEHAVKSRDIIKSDKYQLYFPHVKMKRDEDNKTNYKTINNGQRYATSTGGAVTGVHGHINTIDDPLNPKQAASEAHLAEAIHWFDHTLSMRKVDKELTVTIVIMQRLAVGDTTGHILEKAEKSGKKVRHVCLPGELAPNVSPEKYREIYTDGLLSPKRLSKNALQEAKSDLGTAGYAGQIMQNPAPPGGLIWQKWFIEVEDSLMPPLSQYRQYGTDWDLAYTKDDINAASAYITAGKIGNDIYIDAIGWDWLEFPDLIAFMKKQAGPHYIEAKASGKSAKQTLVKEGINAIEVKVKGGQDKIARAQMSTPPAEAGRVYIRKSLANKLYHDSKQGILFFPKGRYKDLADVLAQAIQRLDKKPVVISTTSRSYLDEFGKD